MSKRTKAYLALLTTTILWGAAFPIIKPSYDHISPFQFLFFRYLIAAPLTLPFLIYYFKKLKPTLKQSINIILLELLGASFALAILYVGLAKTTALEASLIAATSPVITTLGGIIFLKEREEKKEWIGLIISFLGSLILVFEPIFNDQSLLKTFSLSGNLIILSYNFIIAAYYLLAKKHYKNLPKIFVTSTSYLISLITFSVILAVTKTPTPLSLLKIPSVAIATIYMAIPGSIIALTARIYGQNLIEASEASLFQYLQAVVAIPTVFFLLNQTPTTGQLIAIIVILIGVFLGEYRPRKIKR